jgi:RHH-type proline utilization regulon transcriptional repressor/proline dehydrogenase/delta 1-pyrroline-5-carboxylate dehydrogenase
MYRMLSDRPANVMARALAAADPANAADDVEANKPVAALGALREWAQHSGRDSLAGLCDHFAGLSRSGHARTLVGPTGERNVYTLLPREAVLCLASDEADRLVQLAAVLSVGSTAVWPADAQTEILRAALPLDVQQFIAGAQDWTAATVNFDAVLHHGGAAALQQANQALARRDGPIVGMRAFVPGDTAIPLESLIVERSLSVNTAAAGGNASLMTIG